MIKNRFLLVAIIGVIMAVGMVAVSCANCSYGCVAEKDDGRGQYVTTYENCGDSNCAAVKIIGTSAQPGGDAFVKCDC
jgi:hypothetical protein